jgi:5-hydroxyisourate hydrolase
VSTLSTHVLDTGAGVPAVGMSVSLDRLENSDWASAGRGVTDGDGRVGALGVGLEPGTYRLRFATGDYGNEFFPEIHIHIDLDGSQRHYHVPVLLSPYGYTTYRGS